MGFTVLQHGTITTVKHELDSDWRVYVAMACCSLLKTS